MSKKNMYLIKQQNVKGNSKMEKFKKRIYRCRVYQGVVFKILFGRGDAIEDMEAMIADGLLANGYELKARLGRPKVTETKFSRRMRFFQSFLSTNF